MDKSENVALISNDDDGDYGTTRSLTQTNFSAVDEHTDAKNEHTDAEYAYEHTDAVDRHIDKIDGHTDTVDGHIDTVDGHIDTVDKHDDTGDGHTDVKISKESAIWITGDVYIYTYVCIMLWSIHTQKMLACKMCLPKAMGKATIKILNQRKTPSRVGDWESNLLYKPPGFQPSTTHICMYLCSYRKYETERVTNIRA